jgi:serine/threonine-protein phosphatase 2A regulatory subunit A
MIADKFVKIATIFGPDIVRDYLVGAFVVILKDVEPEVKTAACAQLPGFAALVPADILLADVLPAVKDLSSDSSQHVRAALATNVSGLAPILGKEEYFSLPRTIEQLLPLFLQLLKDETSEVRLNIIAKLERVNEGRFL